MLLPRINLINKKPILINTNTRDFSLVNKIYKYYLYYQNTTFSFYKKRDLKDFLINQYNKGCISNLENMQIKVCVSKSWINILIKSTVSDHFEVKYY